MSLVKWLSGSVAGLALVAVLFVGLAGCCCGGCGQADEGCSSCAAAKTSDGWCDGCGVGYVDGEKTACKGCFTAKVSDDGGWCEGCGVGYAKGQKTKCKGCLEAIQNDGKCEHCNVAYKDGKKI